MNILIVDDKEENTYLLETLLKGNGYDTHTSANGAEAFEYLKSEQVDLIISDILMPVMDGFELCRKVRKDERLFHIPFIVYTATYTGPQDEEFAVKIGADRFIAKPCEPDIFIQTVHDVISSAKTKTKESAGSPHEQEVLKLYNERLVRKLEQKMLQLEKEVQTRQKAEEKLEKINRIYAVLSEINKAIVRTGDRQDLFENTCRIAVETGKFRFCWIGIIDSESGNVLPAAHYGFSGTYLEKIDNSPSPDQQEICGPMETVFKEGKYIICNDIENNEKMSPWREKALEHGYRSSAAFPLTISGQTCGAINLYSSQTAFFDDEEINLLKELSSDISYSIEILEREKQKQKIEKERDRLFNYSIDMMCIAGFDGYFKQLNPAWGKSLGWTDEELLSKPYIEFVHPEDCESTLETVGKLATGKLFNSNFLNRYLCKNGTYKWLSWNSVTLKDENLIFAVIRDVTESVKNEKERKNLEAQLIQAQKLESLGTMAGGIAHDFNNILNIIIGYSSMLSSIDTEGNELQKSAEIILDASKRGAELVNRLLTFARKSESVFQSVHVNNIIIEIEKFIKETFPKTIDINCDLQKDLPIIIGDSTQIHQVFLNLCVNARDAMQKGGTLTISTNRMNGDILKAKYSMAEIGTYIEVRVRDTGTGIEGAVKQKIFDPFFTTKEKNKGTGLGLALVYAIIKNHGGFIDVSSEIGKGTVFYIYLPAQEHGKEIRQISSKTDNDIPQGTGTILLIEDEEISSELLTKILVLKGYKVITAYDGLQGIMAYQNHKDEITLVISDLGLPRLDGEEVFKQIKTINPEARVILISGYTDPEIIARLYEEGVRNIIQKPYMPADILRMIKDVTENK